MYSLVNKKEKFFDWLSYGILLLTIGLVPLFLDNRILNPFVLPKLYVGGGLILLYLAVQIVKAFTLKQLTISYSKFTWSIVLLLVVGALSCLFSSSPSTSFIGHNDYFSLSLLALLLGGAFYFFLTAELFTVVRWRQALDVLVVVGCAAVLLFDVRVFLKINIFSHWFSNLWNTTDAINGSFGLYIVGLFLLVSGVLIGKGAGVFRTIAYSVVAALCLVGLVLLNFSIFWWLLLLGSVLILLFATRFANFVRRGWLSLLFAVALLSGGFLLVGTPTRVPSQVPAEVSLSFTSSWKIVSATLFSNAKHLVFGNGFGSFADSFMQYRDIKFNTDPVAWSLRFNRPGNTLLEILDEGGMLLAGMFIVLMVMVAGSLWQSNRIIFAAKRIETFNFVELTSPGLEQDKLFFRVLMLAIPWAVLSAGMACVFYGATLWFVWWTTLGLIVAGLAIIRPGMVKHVVLFSSENVERSLVFSYVLILFLAGIVMSGVEGWWFYQAEMAYTQAYQTSDLEAKKNLLERAVHYREQNSSYHVALASVDLQIARELSQAAAPDTTKINELLTQTVQHTQRAAQLGPQSGEVWENVASIYEMVANVIPDAGSQAVNALQEAKKLEPTNPAVWWRLGEEYALAGRADDAINAYNQAIFLKNDYTLAYSSLTSIYEQTGKTDKAVEMYNAAFPLVQNDPQYLFNFGRVLYNRNEGNDREAALRLWLQAVTIQPDFSNALYSIAVYYETKGDKRTAAEYYKKVAELNPNNKDVMGKINSLSPAPVTSSTSDNLKLP